MAKLVLDKFVFAFILILVNGTNGYLTLQPEESYPIWSSGGYTVTVDVRSEEEFISGHLSGAFLVENMATVQKVPMELLGCEDCPIAVYCRSGARASVASRVFESAGFTNVTNILGISQINDYGLFDIETGMKTAAPPICNTHPGICSGDTCTPCPEGFTFKDSETCLNQSPNIISGTEECKQSQINFVKQKCCMSYRRCPDNNWNQFVIPKWKVKRNCSWLNKLFEKQRKKYCDESFSTAAEVCPYVCEGLCKCQDGKYMKFKTSTNGDDKMNCKTLGEMKKWKVKQICKSNKNARKACSDTCQSWC